MGDSSPYTSFGILRKSPYLCQKAEAMQTLEALAKLLMQVGLFLLIVGGILWLVSRVVELPTLPGDIIWRKKNVTIYFPIGTMIVLSVVLTVLLNLLLWFWRHFKH